MSRKESARLADLQDWLEKSREPYEMSIQDIQGLMLPHRMEITTAPRQGKQRIPISYDSTAANAADALVNFLVGSVLPATADFLKFGLFLKQPTPEEQERLDRGTEKMLEIFDNSNFYEAGAVSLKDLWVLGNTTFYNEEAKPNAEGELFQDSSGFTGLSFEGVQFANLWRHLDRQGNILVLSRLFNMTFLEAKSFFGSKWRAKGEPSESAPVYNIIERTPSGKFKVSWWDKERDAIIGKQETRDTIRYSSHRLDQVGNEQYGVGRGHIARPTAAGMNELRRQLLNATGRSLNTSLVVENESVIRTERGTGGLIVMREGSSFQPFYLRGDVDLAAADAIFRADSLQVERAFMSDILLDPESQPRSAEESRLRQARLQNRIAGPSQVVKRWLAEVVGGAVSTAVRAGALPEFEGLGRVKPIFNSPFFIAQRQVTIQKVLDFVQLKVQLAQAANDPKILDDVSFDKVSAFLREKADVPDIFNDPEMVREMRLDRADIEGTREGLEQAALAAQVGAVPNEAEVGGF